MMRRCKLTLTQVSMYSFGSFFAWPHKIAMNAAMGSSYAEAKQHFIASHRGAVNLALHFVALVGTVLANGAVLCAVDAHLPPQLWLPAELSARWFSALTVVLWTVALAASPAPFLCTLLSAATIALGIVLAPSVLTDPDRLETAVLAAFLGVLLVGTLISFACVPKRVRCRRPVDRVKTCLILVAWKAG
jgi:hypothetical protein